MEQVVRLQVPAHLLRVAALIPELASYAEIAQELGLTYDSVKSRAKELLDLTGMDNRVMLAVALATGRIVLEPKPRVKRRRAHDGP